MPLTWLEKDNREPKADGPLGGPAPCCHGPWQKKEAKKHGNHLVTSYGRVHPGEALQVTGERGCCPDAQSWNLLIA